MKKPVDKLISTLESMEKTCKDCRKEEKIYSEFVASIWEIARNVFEKEICREVQNDT